MPPKAPEFSKKGLTGTIQTEDAVQTGCVWCLHEGLTAPAEHHVAYLYQGTSYCGKHLNEKVFNAQTS
jgi:hypothetical protein